MALVSLAAMAAVGFHTSLDIIVNGFIGMALIIKQFYGAYL